MKTSSVRISLNISEWTNFPSQHWVLNWVKANIEMDQIGQIQTNAFIPRNLGWGRYWVRVRYTQRMACMPLLVSILLILQASKYCGSAVFHADYINFGKSQTLPLEIPPIHFSLLFFSVFLWFPIHFPKALVLRILALEVLLWFGPGCCL